LRRDFEFDRLAIRIAANARLDARAIPPSKIRWKIDLSLASDKATSFWNKKTAETSHEVSAAWFSNFPYVWRLRRLRRHLAYVALTWISNISADIRRLSLPILP